MWAFHVLFYLFSSIICGLLDGIRNEYWRSAVRHLIKKIRLMDKFELPSAAITED